MIPAMINYFYTLMKGKMMEQEMEQRAILEAIHEASDTDTFNITSIKNIVRLIELYASSNTDSSNISLLLSEINGQMDARIFYSILFNGYTKFDVDDVLNFIHFHEVKNQIGEGYRVNDEDPLEVIYVFIHYVRLFYDEHHTFPDLNVEVNSLIRQLPYYQYYYKEGMFAEEEGESTENPSPPISSSFERIIQLHNYFNFVRDFMINNINQISTTSFLQGFENKFQRNSMWILPQARDIYEFYVDNRNNIPYNVNDYVLGKMFGCCFLYDRKYSGVASMCDSTVIDYLEQISIIEPGSYFGDDRHIISCVGDHLNDFMRKTLNGFDPTPYTQQFPDILKENKTGKHMASYIRKMCIALFDVIDDKYRITDINDINGLDDYIVVGFAGYGIKKLDSYPICPHFVIYKEFRPHLYEDMIAAGVMNIRYYY